METNFNVKYLENSKKDNVGVKGRQIGNKPWAFEWHYEHWPQMTFNPLSSRLLKFDIKYFDNGDR